MAFYRRVYVRKIKNIFPSKFTKIYLLFSDKDTILVNPSLCIVSFIYFFFHFQNL